MHTIRNSFMLLKKSDEYLALPWKVSHLVLKQLDQD